MNTEQALQALAAELEKHLAEAAGNRFSQRRDQDGTVAHSIADAISRLIDAKLTERRSGES